MLWLPEMRRTGCRGPSAPGDAQLVDCSCLGMRAQPRSCQQSGSAWGIENVCLYGQGAEIFGAGRASQSSALGGGELGGSTLRDLSPFTLLFPDLNRWRAQNQGTFGRASKALRIQPPNHRRCPKARMGAISDTFPPLFDHHHHCRMLRARARWVLMTPKDGQPTSSLYNQFQPDCSSSEEKQQFSHSA